MVDFLISLAILVGLMVWYGCCPAGRSSSCRPSSALLVLASLGPALCITALNVKYRDFRYVIPFIVQFGLYVSPVGFSSAVIPAEWRFFYSLNPMVGVIDGFRWCLLAGRAALLAGLLRSASVVVAAFLWLGVRYFRRTEKTFADSSDLHPHERRRHPAPRASARDT